MLVFLGMIVVLYWFEEVYFLFFENLDFFVFLYDFEIFRCILLDLCGRLFEWLKVGGIVFLLLVEIDEGVLFSVILDVLFVMVVGDLVFCFICRYRVEMEFYCGKKNLEKMNMDKLYVLWVIVFV